MKPQSQPGAAAANSAARAQVPHQNSDSSFRNESGALGDGADFFVVRQDRIRAERHEEFDGYEETPKTDSGHWRAKRRTELDHLDTEEFETARPHLRLVDSMSSPSVRIAKAKPARVERPRQPNRKMQPCHFGLLVCTLLLTLLSIPLIYSASAPIAIDQHHGDPNFFLVRQALYVAIGLGVMTAVSRLAPEKLRYVAWGLFGFSVLGLLATKFSPLGYTMGNTERWVKLGPVTIQFSEVAKIALIGVMADFWSRAAKDPKKPWWPWLAAGAITIVPVGLVVLQPHLSAAIVLIFLAVAVAFFSGVPVKQIGALAGGAAVMLMLVMLLCRTGHMPGLKPYQAKRITAWMDGGAGKKDTRDSNYQSTMGMSAFGNGGLVGQGPGASFFKNGHLPAPHTDFVFAVTGEEWGLCGSVFLLFLYASLVFFCFQVAHTTKDHFEQLLCAGVGTMIGVQSVGNVAMVSGLMPVTGLPLPIITFGGSGLWCILGGIGLVLAVSRSLNEEEA